MTEAPRGIRIANPTLLRRSAIPWFGKVSPSPDPEFESFDTLENGIRAGAVNQMTHWKRGVRTVAELIELQAPPSENATPAYIAFVAGQLGVRTTQPIDLSDLRVLELFIAAIIAIECAHWPVPPEVIRSGCARAL